MSWITSILGRFGTKASAVARHISLGHQGVPLWTPIRYDLLAREAYQKNGIAHSCIAEIAKAVGQAPFVVYQVASDGSRKEVHDHPVAKLLRRPNPKQSRAAFMAEVAAYLAIAGNSYIEGVGPATGKRAGQFLELWTKRPDRMSVIPGPEGVAFYRHEVNGQAYQWEVDPVTGRSGIRHLKLFHPLNDWYGLSPIEVASMDVDGHNETRAWNQALLRNSARPSGALTTERRLTDVQFTRLKGEIDEQYSGISNAGRPMLLEDGLTWQQFSFSPRDLDFLNSRHTSARDICTIFGVPPMLLGIPGDNTYSNQREARLAFFDTTVTAYLSHIQDDLGHWLFGDDAGEYELGFDLDAIPAMALRREQMFDRAAAATFISMNEKREMAGFGKLDGEMGEVVLVPNTMRPLEQALKEPPDPIALARATAEARASFGGNKPGDEKPGKDDDAGDVVDPAAGDPKKTPKPKAPAAARAGAPRAANDKTARRVAAMKAAPSTLRAARVELGLSRSEFALWLVVEQGLADGEALELAELSEPAA